MQSHRCIELHILRGSTMSCDAELAVIANLSKESSVSTQHQVIRVAFFLERVATAPHDSMHAPIMPFDGDTGEEAKPVLSPFGPLAIGNLASRHRMRIELELRVAETPHPLGACGTGLAVAHGSARKLLPAFMYDVPLRVEREARVQWHARTKAGVESLAMVACVEALPVDPDVVSRARLLDAPLQAHFMGARERQRLALERRQQRVRRVLVGAGAHAARGRRVERTENEFRCAAFQLERNHRLGIFECAMRPIAALAKKPRAQCCRFAELEVQVHTPGGAKNRLAFAEGICKLGVIPVEEEVSASRHALRVRSLRQRGQNEEQEDDAHPGLAVKPVRLCDVKESVCSQNPSK